MNNKILSIWLLGIAIVSLVIASLIFSATNGANFMNENSKHVNEQKIVSSENISNANIKTTSENIILLPTESNEFTFNLEGQINENEEIELVIKEDNGELIAYIFHKPEFQLLSFSNELTLEVKVPVNYDNDLIIESISGNINANDISVNSIDLNSVSGNIRTEDLNAIELIQSTTSGNIFFYDLISMNANMKSVSGNINGKGFDNSKSVFKTTSGNINLHFANAGSLIDAKSVSGNVKLLIPDTHEFNLDFASSSGKISNTIPIISESMDENSLQGTVGNSENMIKVKTTSGDFSLTG